MAEGASSVARRSLGFYKAYLNKDRRPLVLLWVCAVAFGAGAWFLLRGMAAIAPAPHLPLPYGMGEAFGLILNLFSALLGVALLCASAGLSILRPWAWLMLALCAPLVVVLALLAWWAMGIVDWAAMFFALALALTAAQPAVRELFLQAEPARAPSARDAQGGHSPVAPARPEISIPQ